MNNKGFTLIELLATIIVLALVMSIGTYSIIQVMNGAKEKDYELLITNINSAVELYYQECRYAYTTSIDCPSVNGVGENQIALGDLVKYGFLKGNNPNDDGTYNLVNTKDNVNIESCIIKYSYENGKIKVTAVNATGSCPKEY